MVNYVYTVEQSELCLHIRTKKIMSTQWNRMNFVYTVEQSEL